MRKTIAMLGLLLLPASVLAQGRAERRPGGRNLQGNVIERVLQHKADLALSAEQVTRLEALSKELTEQQKPIVEELRKQRENGVRPRDMSEAQREEARKTMEKLRVHREHAMASLKEVLNDEQEAKIKTLLEEGRRGDRTRPERRTRR